MFERFGDWALFPHVSAKAYQDKRRILKCGVLVIHEAQAGADACIVSASVRISLSFACAFRPQSRRNGIAGFFVPKCVQMEK